MMKKISIATASAALLALSAAKTAQAGTLIDTTPSWNGTNVVVSMGEGTTTTYGQTFTVGSDNVLNDFSFWLNGYNFYPDVVDFAAYIAEWDGSKITGPILYSSPQQATTNELGPEQFTLEQFTFKTGGLSLESDKQYVAFLSASYFLDGIQGEAAMGIIGIYNDGVYQDTYSGGTFVYSNNESNFSLLSQNAWDSVAWNADFGDTAFKASFSKSVPEPGSVISLLVFGTLGAGLTLKRKQQKVRVKA
jgi:hypothetical protein